MLKKVRQIVVWLPTFAFLVHATLVLHVITVLRHWPRQYQDLEIQALRSATLRSHEQIANIVGIYLLPLAIVAMVVIGLSRARLSIREITIFAAPVLTWMASIFLIRELSLFYGWLWD